MKSRRQNNSKRLGLRNSLTSPKQEKLVRRDKSITFHSFPDTDICTIFKGEDQNILESYKGSHTSEKDVVNENVKNERFSPKSHEENGLDGKELRNPSYPESVPETAITIASPTPDREGRRNLFTPIESKSFLAMRDLMVRSVFSSRPMSQQLTSSTSDRRSSSAREKEEGDEPQQEETCKEESNHIAYLTVPSVTSSRRPSTADIVIEKLQVEKVEGGGITISGVSLAANCHITLMIFGSFFILAGIVLSYVGFASSNNPIEGVDSIVAQASGGSGEDQMPPKTHRQMQIIGPLFIVGGLMMLFLGISLFAISSKITRDEKERRLLISAMQLCQLENNFIQTRVETNISPVHTISAPSQNQGIPVLSLRRGSWWMEPTPVEYPLIPAEVIPGSDCPPSYSRSESGRSPSPLPESAMAWSQQQSANDKNSLQQQSSPAQHQQQYQQQQQFANKCLSSPSVSSFYGRREGTTDIATFPLESYNPANSYPLRVQSLLEGPERADESSSLQEGTRKSSCDGESSENFSTTASVPLITVSSVANMERANGSVFSSSKTTTSSSNNSPMVCAVQPVSTNFPLSRNGVAIPRHSRHSNSPKSD